MAFQRLDQGQLPALVSGSGQGQPFQQAFSAGSASYTPPPASSAPVNSAEASGNPFGGMMYADSPGIFGMIARLTGKPTRAEAYAQRTGGMEQESFKELSNLMDQGMSPQKAFVTFINSPKGHDLFVQDPNALGQVMNYLKTYSGPTENLTQTEKGTEWLQKNGFIDEEFKNKWNSGLIKQEAVLNPIDNTPTGAYQYRDLSTGKLLFQAGPNSPVNGILSQDKPEQAAGEPESQQPPSPTITPTPRTQAGSAAPTTQNSQQPTRIATDQEIAGTDHPLVTELKDADGNPDPADVIRAAGLVPALQRWLGGYVSIPVPGLDARQAVSYANALTQIRFDAQKLQGIMKSGATRATKDDGDLLDQVTGITQSGVSSSPGRLGTILIQYNGLLDRMEVQAKEDAVNPRISQARRKEADETLGAIEAAHRNLPSVVQLEAKMNQIDNEPSPLVKGVVSGLDSLRKIVGATGQQVKDVESNKPQVYQSEKAAHDAYARGELSDCDYVTIGQQTFQINQEQCGQK